MIICYSKTQKTKFYAQVLSDILERPVYMLEAEQVKGLGLLWSVLTKKSAEVFNMPSQIADEEIYICCPVWGGWPAAPIRYFLNNAPIKGKKVNMILTASLSHTKYTDKAIKLLNDAECVPGRVEVFATGGGVTLERDIIESHIRHLIFDEDIS